MRYLIFAGAIVLCSIYCWYREVWRDEKELKETLFIFNLARIFETNPEARKDFSDVVAVATKGLPEARRALIEDIAHKYHRTPEEFEHALIADTGASSIDEALRTPLGKSSLEDKLLQLMTATRDPFRLAIRWWMHHNKR